MSKKWILNAQKDMAFILKLLDLVKYRKINGDNMNI